MTQTKTCHRIVLISGSAPATRYVQDREPVPHRTTGQRIIIIRNGEFVSHKRKRRTRKPD
jgi:hypothetical protein